MIPKILHYCWFGGNEMPPIAQKCIESWKENLPDYQIVRWDETNFDVNSTPFTRRAYADKKYAFVSDYVRLKALSTQGGVYMDIDELAVRDFSELLKGRELVACFETKKSVMVGMVAASPGCKLLDEFMQVYDKWDVSGEKTEYIPNPVFFTKLLVQRGLELNGQLQLLDGDKIAIYPNEYFCGFDFELCREVITENTYAIQKYAGTWDTRKGRLNRTLQVLLPKLVGDKLYLRIKKVKKAVQSMLFRKAK